MRQGKFISAHPRLYHMATAQAMPSIERFGLLSTDAILNLCEVEATVAERLRSSRRPQMTKLVHPENGVFYLRDQKPLRDAALEQCLDGMTVPEWYRSLNSRVFMWASKDRVETLMRAKAYRTEDQLVLTVDTARFVARYFTQIFVTTLNSGATLYTPLRRGLQTFVPLADFSQAKPIVEVTVLRAIPDFADFVIESEVRRAAVE